MVLSYLDAGRAPSIQLCYRIRETLFFGYRELLFAPATSTSPATKGTPFYRGTTALRAYLAVPGSGELHHLLSDRLFGPTLLDTPHARHDAVSTVLVAAVDDINPGASRTAPSRLGHVLHNEGRVRRDELVMRTYEAHEATVLGSTESAGTEAMRTLQTYVSVCVHINTGNGRD